MAFSVGFITYTISKLVSKGLLKQEDTVDEFTFVDTSKENGVDSNSEEVTYNEKEIAELFDKMMKPDDFDDTKDVNPFEDDVEMVKVEKSLEQVLEDIYEEVTIRDTYLRYSHGFGDLANLRMRNDFVFKAGDANQQKTQNGLQNQKNSIDEKTDLKKEARRDEQRRFEEIRLQKHSAEQYTQQLSSQD